MFVKSIIFAIAAFVAVANAQFGLPAGLPEQPALPEGLPALPGMNFLLLGQITKICPTKYLNLSLKI